MLVTSVKGTIHTREDNLPMSPGLTCNTFFPYMYPSAKTGLDIPLNHLPRFPQWLFPIASSLSTNTSNTFRGHISCLLIS